MAGDSLTIVIPPIPGIDAVKGESVYIPGSTTALAFQFNDGRIVIGDGDKCMWSYDGGHTWESGPAGPGEKVAIDLGGGEILAIKRNLKRQPDGKFTLRVLRSTDNWQTVKNEEALLDIPRATSTVTGGGDIIDGFFISLWVDSPKI